MTSTSTSFALELLDADCVHVLHTWELGGSNPIQLGRSPESDVVFTSPYVSRTHAHLYLADAGWELVAISRNGVFVEGKRTERLLLCEGSIFRLADRGPWLRFRSEASVAPESGVGETMSIDELRTPLLVLDGNQLEQEVKQITDGDYFQELQRRMAELRSQRSAGTKSSAEKSN